MTWLLLPLALAGIAAGCWYWGVVVPRREKAPAKGITMTGPAPGGSRPFLEALCWCEGWSGCAVEWHQGRIPAGYGSATYHPTAAEFVTNRWAPAFAVDVELDWRELLCHAACHVPLMRAGRDGVEPDPARVAALLRAVNARVAG